MASKKPDEATLRTLPGIHDRGPKGLFARVHYRDSAGKWRSVERKVSTVDDAVRVLAELRRQVGDPSTIDGERMTFAALLDEYARAHPSRPRWYIEPLREYFGPRLVRSITYGGIRQFRDARAAVPKKDGSPRKNATVNRELEQLRAVLLYAHRHGWIPRNPFSAGEPLIQKRPEDARDRVPTPDEEARILEHCVGKRAHLRQLVIATRDTGLRRSALQSLRWSDVDLARGILRVPPPRSSRKKRPRVIVLTQRLRSELARLRLGQNLDDRIFPVGDFKRSWKTACRLADVHGLRFNDFRHGFATDLLEAGVEHRLAMAAAGHSSTETHAIYTNVDERLARQVAEALDRLHHERDLDSGAAAEVVH